MTDTYSESDILSVQEAAKLSLYQGTIWKTDCTCKKVELHKAQIGEKFVRVCGDCGSTRCNTSS